MFNFFGEISNYYLCLFLIFSSSDLGGSNFDDTVDENDVVVVVVGDVDDQSEDVDVAGDECYCSYSSDYLHDLNYYY